MQHKTMGWHPDNADNKLSVLFGIVGGMAQYLLNIHLPTDFLSKLMESAITAAVCGIAGIAGKELFKVLRASLTEYIKRKKNIKTKNDHND